MQAGDVVTTTNFDSDFSPYHDINKEAAKARGVKYDPRTRTYRDDDGHHRYDEYGQAL